MSSAPDVPGVYGLTETARYAYLFEQPAPPQTVFKLPTLCTSIFILDLVLCSLRVPLVGLSILGVAHSHNPTLLKTGPYEVLCGLGIAVFGITASLAMLSKQRWGLVAAWLNIAATVGFMVVSVFQLPYFLGRFSPGTPQYAGAIVGWGFSLMVRLVMLGLYVAAVVVFTKWLAKCDAATSPFRQTQTAG